MRLPLLAFGLAKRTHAPSAIGLFENGLVRDRVPPPDLYTMSDAPNVAGAAWATGLLEVMQLLQRGDVDLGFIGGAEVDRFGNINTSVIGSPEQPTRQAAGQRRRRRHRLSGAAAGVADGARAASAARAGRLHHVARAMATAAPDWRARQGLVRGGPSAVITTLGVLRFDPQTHEAYLASYHPFTTPDDVQAATGWQLRIASDCGPTPAPSARRAAADPRG